MQICMKDNVNCFLEYFHTSRKLCILSLSLCLFSSTLFKNLTFPQEPPLKQNVTHVGLGPSSWYFKLLVTQDSVSKGSNPELDGVGPVNNRPSTD